MSKISADDDVEGSTWIKEEWKKDATNSELYLLAFYYIITTMTTVGYGDIYPT